MATIGGESLGPIGANVTRLVVDAQKRIFISDFSSPGMVLVFDSVGRPITSIGRVGSGPGEFREIVRLMVGRGDSVHVFGGDQRHSVISPTTLGVVRQEHWQSRWPSDIVPVGHGFIKANVEATPDGVGHPLHRVDSAGRLVKSFGGEDVVFTRAVSRRLGRLLAPDDSGGALSFRALEYTIEAWSSSGTLTRAWTRAVPWFPTSSAAREVRDPSDGLAPLASGIVKDTGDLVWTSTLVLDRDWRSAITDIRSEGMQTHGISDPGRYFDTVIEVISLRRNLVLASQRFDQPLFLATHGIGWYAYDNRARPIDIWKFSLARTQP